jgi:hypothetical protein
MFFLIRIDSQIQATETTTTMLTMTTIEVPEPKYRRLDMAKLPPYRLERLSQKERNEKYLFLDLFSPIQYRNIWDDETEVKLAEDEQKAHLARPVTRMTQTKSRKMRRPFCTFCYQRRLPLKDCKTHYTKSGPEFGSEIICPVLLQQQCARCGEIGHTPKYCKSEDWLKTDPLEILPCRDQHSFNWFPFAFISDNYLPQWQKPIPPAFQKRHEEYEETHVKTSRIWIEMTGDHKHYTNDFRLVMLIEKEDDWFEKKPRTEYENRVQEHWEMMRKVIWDDETPIRSSRDHFYIVRSPPPSYEQAIGAVKFLESVEATKAAAAAAVAATTKENDSTEFDKQVWECEKAMREIIGKYIDHQRR